MPDTGVEFSHDRDTYDISEQWWRDFKDERLNKLIDRALKQNANLVVAANNLEKAKLNLGIAKIGFLPNVNLQGSAGRTRTSGETNYPDNIKSNNFSLGAALSWEIDLWGRVANSVRANKASFKASKFDLENAKLSIAANTAKTYFALISINEQKNILSASLESYENSLQMRQKELEVGATSILAYEQTSIAVESARSRLAALKDQISQTKIALGILSGADVSEILSSPLNSASQKDEMNSLQSVFLPSVPSGISSDILLRRPDVASALERLKATNALVGVARASYLPSLSLTGLFGFASKDLNRLFKSNAATWNAGASVSMPLIDFGKTADRVDLAKLDVNSSFISYKNTLQSAFGEIAKALNSRQNAIENLNAAQKSMSSQSKIFAIYEARYEQGYASYADLLDAKRAHLNARLNLSTARLNSLTNAVEIYKVLGGGFKSEKIGRIQP